jgi:hypothetical protein
VQPHEAVQPTACGYTNEQLNMRSADRGADLGLTGSVPATAVLGGLAYALIHVFDGWALYSDLPTAALTVAFLVLQYFGPGLVT